MTHRTVRAALVALSSCGALALAMAPGCGESLSQVHKSCSINSDCDSPLVCVFSQCHNQCNTSADCPLGARCIPAGTEGGALNVCQLEQESTCPSGSCVGDLVCGADEQCRAPCTSASNCPAEQSCEPSGSGNACFDPHNPNDEIEGGSGKVGTGGAGGAAGKGNGGAGAAGASSGGESSGDASTGGGTGEGTRDAGTGSGGRASLKDAAGDAPLASKSDGGLPFKPPNIDEATLEMALKAVMGKPPDVRNSLASPIVINQDDSAHTAADLYLVNSWTVDATTTVTPANNGRPIIIVALTTVDIEGHVQIDGTSNDAGPGGYSTTSGCGNSGPGGGRMGASGAYLNSNGGGGAYCGNGGLGGESSPPPAPGGMPYGEASLTPLLGGSAGGCAYTNNPGGGGGGAIEITAGESIAVETYGTIDAGGGGGPPGGGGGGSGGAILLVAPDVTIRGTLAANGGGGAIEGDGDSSTIGEDGTTDMQPAFGGRLSNVEAGGEGSAGAVTDGGNGSTVKDPRGGTQTDLGGGGGGAGRIRINTATGSATVTSTAVISPALTPTTSCATQGKLTD